MLRCNEPAPLMMLSALHDLDGFGMRDRPDAQEILDTHPHHSSSLSYARDVALYFWGASKQKCLLLFLFFSIPLSGDGGMGRRACFLDVKRSWVGKGESCTRRGPFLLPTYFLLLQIFALWLRRYPGTWLYTFWERGLPGLALLFLELWAGMRGVMLDCIGVANRPPFVICAALEQ